MEVRANREHVVPARHRRGEVGMYWEGIKSTSDSAVYGVLMVGTCTGYIINATSKKEWQKKQERQEQMIPIRKRHKVHTAR